MKTLLVLLLIFILSWDLIWWMVGVKPVFPHQLKQMLRSSAKKPVLADVRTSFEYNWFHIPGAEHYPNLLLYPGIFPEEDSETPIVVICLSGHRSPVAAYRLRKRGIKNVSYLAWGMIAWLLSHGQIIEKQDKEVRG